MMMTLQYVRINCVLLAEKELVCGNLGFAQKPQRENTQAAVSAHGYKPPE